MVISRLLDTIQSCQEPFKLMKGVIKSTSVPVDGFFSELINGKGQSDKKVKTTLNETLKEG